MSPAAMPVRAGVLPRSQTRTTARTRNSSRPVILSRRTTPAITITTMLATALAMSAVTGVQSPLPAAADSAVKAHGGGFTVSGQGFGHGRGMSQYGAYGAARQGKDWKQILRFYYPGTTLSSQSPSASIKVWITADNDNVLRLPPSRGLKVSDAHGHSLVLPTGSNYVSWRIRRSGSGYRLTYKNRAGDWRTLRTRLDTSTWTASNQSKIMKVVLPGGVVREYRGSLSQVKRGSGGRTVNKVGMEDYLKTVVPSEMPTSWAIDAVRAQAVAARSYAARLQADANKSTGYDLCDTTSCQVYKPYASDSPRSRRVVNGTSRGNAAIKTTARKILTYGTYVVFAEFSSSNGGYLADGGRPYLKAKKDPYDGVITSGRWSRAISASSVQRQWPSAGTVRSVKISKRDGRGRWGGRVGSIKIIGSKRTVTVSGGAFQSRFGLRSNLFSVS